MPTSTNKDKLTLWLDRDAIAFGKAEAKRHHKSLSEMFTDFIYGLRNSSSESAQLSVRVKRLKGVLRKSQGEEEYRHHLEQKYLRKNG